MGHTFRKISSPLVKPIQCPPITSLASFLGTNMYAPVLLRYNIYNSLLSFRIRYISYSDGYPIVLRDWTVIFWVRQPKVMKRAYNIHLIKGIFLD